MNIEEQIKTFVQSKNVDETYKTKSASRLKESVTFFAGVGVTDIPSEAQYDELTTHLQTLTQPRGKHKGQPYSETVIRDWKSLTKSFYEWRKNNMPKDTNTLEGENMTMIQTNEHTATENTATQLYMPIEDELRKPGRPEVTGRSEKFTLYMKPSLMKKIRMLADLDEETITDFMNAILESYCDEQRAQDLDFLYSLERRKQEHRLQKQGK